MIIANTKKKELLLQANQVNTHENTHTHTHRSHIDDGRLQTMRIFYCNMKMSDGGSQGSHG